MKGSAAEDCTFPFILHPSFFILFLTKILPGREINSFERISSSPILPKPLAMLRVISLFFGAILRLLRRRQSLLLENLALRQQVSVLKRKNRPKLTRCDRWFWQSVDSGRSGRILCCW
jgi:hypothetical protein